MIVAVAALEQPPVTAAVVEFVAARVVAVAVVALVPAVVSLVAARIPANWPGTCARAFVAAETRPNELATCALAAAATVGCARPAGAGVAGASARAIGSGLGSPPSGAQWLAERRP